MTGGGGSYRFAAATSFRTSPASGKRSSFSFEKSSFPSRLTSKQPPSPGTSVNASTSRLKLVSSSAARPTAFGS